MKYSQLLKRGIIDENPTLVQLISLCPLLAVTTSAVNALTMGLATTAVMICACVAISLTRKLIPGEIRIASWVVIVAGFVVILQLLMEAFAPPSINDALGIFIPLIVVNCILFARIEAFASKNKAVDSAVDALGMGLGLTLGLLIVGIVREFLGNGTIFGIVVIPESAPNMLIMIMAPGAFFTLAIIIMVMRLFKARKGEDA